MAAAFLNDGFGNAVRTLANQWTGSVSLLARQGGGGGRVPVEASSTGLNAGAEHRKILIVEDEALTALDIASELEDRGYHVVGAAATSAAAIELARRTMPDLVLLDITLKGAVDGIETARLLQELGIPFIYVTAHADAPTARRAQAFNPRGYLLKPFTPKQLTTAVDAALGPQLNS